MPPDVSHLPVKVIYSDDDVAVAHKPPGLLSIPGRDPSLTDCMQRRLRQLFPHAQGFLLPHRLDMDTSGIMVAGLHADAHRQLVAQFEARAIDKHYVALVGPGLRGQCGSLRLPFRLDVEDRPRQIYDEVHGKMGHTDWKVMARTSEATRLSLTPHTGRTHQLRIHLAHAKGLGSPILGDRLYGDVSTAPRLMLHAECLSFDHPGSEERMTFRSAVPF